MAVLAILEADARAAARLSTALGGEHVVVVRATWEALHRALARDSFDLCLVDADNPDRAGAISQIAALREDYPGTAVVACVEQGDDLGYYDLGGLGIAGVMACRAAAAARIRAEIDQALATARADRIARSLEGRFAPPGPDAVGWAVEHAGPDTTVEKLAAALGHTPRGLRQALEDAGLPAPTRVLLWGRLLLAGARLGRDGRTVEEVAFSLGYSTATSLARAMKSQTGLTPGEVSEEGGMERVRAALFPGPRSRALRRLGRIASVLLLAAVGACATLGAPAGSDVEADAIDHLLDTPPLARAHVGVLAVDEPSGRILYSHNADRWFVPASNQKLVVTAAAWSLLGPDHRWQTELWATGPVAQGRLEGDLVLVGSGDPSLSARYHESGVATLDDVAAKVRLSLRIREITGRLLVDVSAWDSTTVSPTREVNDLIYSQGATGGAFAIDEGEITVIVRGGPEPGVPARVEWAPRGPDGYVQARVATVHSDSTTRVVAHYLPESRRLVLEGHARAGIADTLAFAQRDPVRLAAFELAEALRRAGVRIDGGWRVLWDREARAPAGRPVAIFTSPPLAEIVAGVLGPSQNWMAEQVVRTLGAELGGRGGLEEGLAVVQRFLHDVAGADTLDVRSRDASGLSAYNLVTPRAVVRVLQHMASRPDADAYRRALAEPGEEASTLEDRLAGLEGRVFAKTGTISNVSSLSGYLVRRDGRRIVFAILANAAGDPGGEVRGAIDDIVRALAR